jgi:hypothetical protein
MFSFARVYLIMTCKLSDHAMNWQECQALGNCATDFFALDFESEQLLMNHL